MVTKIELRRIDKDGAFVCYEARLSGYLLSRFTKPHEGTSDEARKAGMTWVRARHAISDTEGDYHDSPCVVLKSEGML